jgi:hypothetical protein
MRRFIVLIVGAEGRNRPTATPVLREQTSQLCDWRQPGLALLAGTPVSRAVVGDCVTPACMPWQLTYTVPEAAVKDKTPPAATRTMSARNREYPDFLGYSLRLKSYPRHRGAGPRRIAI